MLGKIYNIIDNDSATIITSDGKIYFFTTFDIIDDLKIEKGINVLFKPINDTVLRATYVSVYKG